MDALSYDAVLALFDDDDEEFAFVDFVLSSAVVAVASRSRRSKKHGGSRPGRRPNRERNHRDGHNRIMADYFVERPVFSDEHFRRRFRLSRSVFSRVVDCISSRDAYFIQKPDAADRPGLSALQKAISAIRQLAYGTPADSMDEYVRMAETTALESLKRFCVAVIDSLGDEYLRAPTTQDLSRLLRIGEARGFPGMLGSLDCMHWRWKNCPKGWVGQFTGKEKAPTIVLEAVADYEGWMWHLFFGMPGSHNDINVLDRSHLFTDLTDGSAPSVSYRINGTQYSMGYYLADGIYPPWATLVQTISNPQAKKKKFFAEAQESARKDVERAFGMLQSQYAMLTRPCRLWSQEDMAYIANACVILRHMAIEDERDPDGLIFETSAQDNTTSSSTVVTAPDPSTDSAFSSFISRYKAIRNSELHYQLRNDLIEHLWARSGNQNAQ